MERKDLTGYTFTSCDGKTYVITAGCEDGEVAFEECVQSCSPLHFCCDAKPVQNGLRGAYNVSYTVSKEEFFAVIDAFCEQDKSCSEEIASALRMKYYKIPKVFLNLVGEMYLRERKGQK